MDDVGSDEQSATPGMAATTQDGVAPQPTTGVGLCLSGGGFRAMLFHTGAIVRLNQLGLLSTVTCVSSVSGGSIIAGVLGSRWTALEWRGGVATNLDGLVVQPIVDFAGCTVDVPSILRGLVTPRRGASDFVARHYDRHLFHGATLQALPADGEGPQFVIDSTNVQTGKLFRFTRDRLSDYTLGEWCDPTNLLAEAVAASSSFPPLLSPHRLKPTGEYRQGSYPPRHGADFREQIVLTDGGVYDNLGLQAAWPRCRRVFVSDGGAAFRADVRPAGDWARHMLRVTAVIDSQVRALRKIELIESYDDGDRTGTYWGIASDEASYGLPDALPFTPTTKSLPAHVPTRLASLRPSERADLVRWGYVMADTALRTHVVRGTPPPTPDQIPA